MLIYLPHLVSEDEVPLDPISSPQSPQPSHSLSGRVPTRRLHECGHACPRRRWHPHDRLHCGHHCCNNSQLRGQGRRGGPAAGFERAGGAGAAFLDDC